MMKRYKKIIMLTSSITLSPILIGIFLWKKLPDVLVTTWNMRSLPSGYESKTFVVLILPMLILMLHLTCILAMYLDPKIRNNNKKNFSVILWICPLVSITMSGMIFRYNLGHQLNIIFWTELLVGGLYLILGRAIPKIEANYIIGFRIPWTLNDPDNWYHTHQFGGKCMMIGGMTMIATALFENEWVFLFFVLIPCILPCIYSYLYYRKNRR